MSNFGNNVVWFTTSGGVYGVVRKVDDITSDIKYYTRVVEGHNEQSDYETILNWGSSFPTEAGRALFGDEPTQ